jgi:hypothetical protein
MRQITVRGIPEEVEEAARREAREQGVSMNRALVALLRRGAEREKQPGRRGKRNRSSSFDRFCGIWSEEEARAFDQSLADERRIDEELWNDRG